MTSESALLGTPAIVIHPEIMKFGVFEALEKEYHLIKRHINYQTAQDDIRDISSGNVLKSYWKNLSSKAFKDCLDPSLFFSWYLQNYPESQKIIDAIPEIQMKYNHKVTEFS